MTVHRLSWLPFMLLGLVLLGWLWPLLAGESLFWGLPALQFYPWRSYAFAELRAGHLPLWNPYNGGGAPLLANYQTAVFYPPNWLHLVLPDVLAMNVLAVAHIVVAAVGMWLFAGCWQLPPMGRGVSMLSFSLGGYLIGRLGSFPTVAAAAWLPWLFWAIHRLLTRTTLRNGVALAGITALLLLAGHAQTAYYALLGGAGYALWLGWRTSHGRRLLAGWGVTALSVGLGVGLTALQLLPTAQLLLRSSRADGVSYEWVTNFSYSWVRALTLFAPNLFGTPANGSYIPNGIYYEEMAYIGLLPLLAAFFGVLYWLRNFRRAADDSLPQAMAIIPFMSVLAGLSFLVALGDNSFLFPILFRFIPTFDAFQGPVRWLILTVFALSLLGGIGVSYAWHKGRWTIYWSRLFAAGGVGLAIVAGIVAPRMLPADIAELQTMISGFVLLGLFISGCALLTLVQPSTESRWRVWWQIGVMVFLAFDLFLAFRGANPTIPAEFYAPLPVEESADLLYMSADYEEHLKFEVFFTPRDYRNAVAQYQDLRVSMLPNLNLLDRISMLNNFEPMVTQPHADMVEQIERDLPAGTEMVLLGAEIVPRQEPFGYDAFVSGLVITLASLLLSGLLLLLDWRRPNLLAAD